MMTVVATAANTLLCTVGAAAIVLVDYAEPVPSMFSSKGQLHILGSEPVIHFFLSENSTKSSCDTRDGLLTWEVPAWGKAAIHEFAICRERESATSQYVSTCWLN